MEAEDEERKAGEEEKLETKTKARTIVAHHSPNGEGEESILQKTMRYCWGDGFLSVFRRYFRKHASHFEVIAEGKTEEHDLLYQELFNEYLGIFEGTLEDYLASQGSTPEEFYAEVEREKESEDPNVRLFISCLLASCDYDSFFKVMKKEAVKLLAEKEMCGLEGEEGDAADEGKEKENEEDDPYYQCEEEEEYPHKQRK